MSLKLVPFDFLENGSHVRGAIARCPAPPQVSPGLRYKFRLALTVLQHIKDKPKSEVVFSFGLSDSLRP